jgi:diketogulonate reductase-like aldo/keto reductase
VEHVRANAAARDFRIPEELLREIDRAFPPPARKQRLDII